MDAFSQRKGTHVLIHVVWNAEKRSASSTRISRRFSLIIKKYIISIRIIHLPGVTFGNGWPGNDGGCSSSGERSDAYPWSCGSPLSLLSFRSTHLPSCWRCLSSSQSGLCTIFISKSSSAPVTFIMHGCEDDEFDSRLLPLLFLASCLRFGRVPTRSRSEFRWHLSSEDTPRPPYRLPESTSTVSALRFLLTESKVPWRVRTRSRSLCWYLKSVRDRSQLIFHREKTRSRARVRRKRKPFRAEDRRENYFLGL